MKEEPAPICFQLKLVRRHEARARSPSTGTPLQVSQLAPSTLLLPFEGALAQLPGKVPAERPMVSWKLRGCLSGSCLQQRNMTPVLAPGKGVTFNAMKTRYRP